MNRAIKLRYLQAFRAVMDTGGVSSAADRLNLSQPAISKHLIALERAIDLKLFDRRRGGPIVPTREGMAFYRSTQNILAGLGELPDIASEIRNHKRERLRLAATPPAMNSRAMAEALKAFRNENPDVRLALEPQHRLEIEDQVARGQVDLALALLPLDTASLTAIPLATSNAVAIVSLDHPYAERTELTVSDLPGHSLILPSRQPIRTQIDFALSKENIVLQIDIETSSAITCCRLAAAGLGITICDPFSPTAFDQQRLKVIRWVPEVKLVYGALLKRDTKLSPIAENLLAHVEYHLNSESAYR